MSTLVTYLTKNQNNDWAILIETLVYACQGQLAGNDFGRNI